MDNLINTSPRLGDGIIAFAGEGVKIQGVIFEFLRTVSEHEILVRDCNGGLVIFPAERAEIS